MVLPPAECTETISFHAPKRSPVFNATAWPTPSLSELPSRSAAFLYRNCGDSPSACRVIAPAAACRACAFAELETVLLALAPLTSHKLTPMPIAAVRSAVTKSFRRLSISFPPMDLSIPTLKTKFLDLTSQKPNLTLKIQNL